MDVSERIDQTLDSFGDGMAIGIVTLLPSSISTMLMNTYYFNNSTELQMDALKRHSNDRLFELGKVTIYTSLFFLASAAGAALYK